MNPNCPKCGFPMTSLVSDLTLTFETKTVTLLNVRSHFCFDCETIEYDDESKARMLQTLTAVYGTPQ